MKIDERIILYFDGQMNDEEKLNFEKEINESSVLQKQVEDYKSFLKQINDNKNLDFDENYFTNLIPNFRKNLKSKTKKNLNPKIIYGLTTIAVIFISLIFILNSENSSSNLSLKEVISNMDSTELNSTINDYSANLSMYDFVKTVDDSTLNLIIADELNITRESAGNILLSENYDLNKIYNTMSDEEAEAIYDKLLNKKY